MWNRRWLAGGVLAWLVLCPAIVYFGAGLNEPLAPATMLIRDMDAGQLRWFYVLYIGAGAVAAGGADGPDPPVGCPPGHRLGSTRNTARPGAG